VIDWYLYNESFVKLLEVVLDLDVPDRDDSLGQGSRTLSSIIDKLINLGAGIRMKNDIQMTSNNF
jgi:hypothetical protein